MEKFKLKCKGIFSSIGCCRRREKPRAKVSMDEGCKIERIEGQTVTIDDGSSDFWSSSTYDKDHSEARSRRSASLSGITMNPSSDHQRLIVWNQIRQQWGGNKRHESQTVVREPRISSDATYEDLLGNTKPFPQPIPLRV
ncbi:hypothetical protein L195_g031519 [Trifolium pratense]|uniref:DUF4050 domain-containing protein n=1 Tax=Trifolium pratense TaxID=57577 RepID=A0A2K3LAL9_TRIPR|nr:hypothetical protein L195_g031519 [Trifolium pratense]